MFRHPYIWVVTLIWTVVYTILACFLDTETSRVFSYSAFVVGMFTAGFMFTNCWK